MGLYRTVYSIRIRLQFAYRIFYYNQAYGEYYIIGVVIANDRHYQVYNIHFQVSYNIPTKVSAAPMLEMVFMTPLGTFLHANCRPYQCCYSLLPYILLCLLELMPLARINAP